MQSTDLITKHYYEYKLSQRNQKILPLENKIIKAIEEENDTDFKKLREDVIATYKRCFQIIDDMTISHLQHQIKVEYGLINEDDEMEHLQNIKDSLNQVSKISDDFRLSTMKS